MMIRLAAMSTNCCKLYSVSSSGLVAREVIPEGITEINHSTGEHILGAKGIAQQEHSHSEGGVPEVGHRRLHWGSGS